VCGKKKFGAFNKCNSCNYDPETGWEMCVSMILSDTFLSEQDLDRYGEKIARGLAQASAFQFRFDKNSIDFIASHFANPTWRDPLTLVRQARNGWLRRRMNWHTVGPDGYVAKIVTRGKDVSCSTYDAVSADSRTDAFFVIEPENTPSDAKAVSKAAWYCVKDLQFISSSEHLGFEELRQQARKFTTEFLDMRISANVRAKG
jgi:hypothetical protein